MNLFSSCDADEYIIFLINSVSMSEFENFIKSIEQKKNWYEELCCCYFEIGSDNKEYYRFETFEGNTYKLNYEKFIEYVSLAIIRYYSGNISDKMKKSIKETIKNTIFEKVIDNIDSSLAIDMPLIGGEFKYVSKNTIDNLSLHDCSCTKFYYQNNRLVFEMEWMEVLANHPQNPYNKAHQSGVSKIELINPKYLYINRTKNKEGNTGIPIEYTSIEEINNKISTINISETIDILNFDEIKIGNDYCVYVYAIYMKNTNYDAIEMKIIYEESIVSFNDLGDESWFEDEKYK